MKSARIATCSGLAGAVLTAVLCAASAAAQSGTSSALQNPSRTFSAPGLQTVTLEACNEKGCTTVTKTVQVLDPRPAVTSAATVPLTPEVGQLVRLTGAGTGQPQLEYLWRISLGASLVAELPGAAAWWNTAGLEPGAYTVILRIRNASGFADSQPLPVALLASAGLGFYTIAPCRIFDSRGGSPLASGTPQQVAVTASACGIPANARSVALNVTVTGPSAPGYVSLYPGNYPPPETSILNFSTGATRANQAILPLATDGSGTLAAVASVQSNGTTHLIVDASGYFLATP